uniref:Uncharacterized protein n=1 Tax=viral metagenome TaxID=1070528 RepID=A0A6M3LEI9_9ZZZZ
MEYAPGTDAATYRMAHQQDREDANQEAWVAYLEEINGGHSEEKAQKKARLAAKRYIDSTMRRFSDTRTNYEIDNIPLEETCSRDLRRARKAKM